MIGLAGDKDMPEPTKYTNGQLAHNPQTGETLQYYGGQWYKTRSAINDSTGEIKAYDAISGGWHTVSTKEERAAQVDEQRVDEHNANVGHIESAANNIGGTFWSIASGLGSMQEWALNKMNRISDGLVDAFVDDKDQAAKAKSLARKTNTAVHYSTSPGTWLGQKDVKEFAEDSANYAQRNTRQGESFRQIDPVMAAMHGEEAGQVTNWGAAVDPQNITNVALQEVVPTVAMAVIPGIGEAQLARVGAKAFLWARKLGFGVKAANGFAAVAKQPAQQLVATMVNAPRIFGDNYSKAKEYYEKQGFSAEEASDMAGNSAAYATALQLPMENFTDISIIEKAMKASGKGFINNLKQFTLAALKEGPTEGAQALTDWAVGKLSGYEDRKFTEALSDAGHEALMGAWTGGGVHVTANAVGNLANKSGASSVGVDTGGGSDNAQLQTQGGEAPESVLVGPEPQNPYRITTEQHQDADNINALFDAYYTAETMQDRAEIYQELRNYKRNDEDAAPLIDNFFNSVAAENQLRVLNEGREKQGLPTLDSLEQQQEAAPEAEAQQEQATAPTPEPQLTPEQQAIQPSEPSSQVTDIVPIGEQPTPATEQAQAAAAPTPDALPAERPTPAPVNTQQGQKTNEDLIAERFGDAVSSGDEDVLNELIEFDKAVDAARGAKIRNLGSNGYGKQRYSVKLPGSKSPVEVDAANQREALVAAIIRGHGGMFVSKGGESFASRVADAAGNMEYQTVGDLGIDYSTETIGQIARSKREQASAAPEPVAVAEAAPVAAEKVNTEGVIESDYPDKLVKSLLSEGRGQPSRLQRVVTKLADIALGLGGRDKWANRKYLDGVEADLSAMFNNIASKMGLTNANGPIVAIIGDRAHISMRLRGIIEANKVLAASGDAVATSKVTSAQRLLDSLKSISSRKAQAGQARYDGNHFFIDTTDVWRDPTFGASFLSTAAHEFGHYVSRELLMRLQPGSRQAIYEYLHEYAKVHGLGKSVGRGNVGNNAKLPGGNDTGEQAVSKGATQGGLQQQSGTSGKSGLQRIEGISGSTIGETYMLSGLRSPVTIAQEIVQSVLVDALNTARATRIAANKEIAEQNLKLPPDQQMPLHAISADISTDELLKMYRHSATLGDDAEANRYAQAKLEELILLSRSSDRDTDNDKPGGDAMQNVWLEEAVAENIAKWIFTSQKPKTEVDRFFKTIADALREFFNFIVENISTAKRAGISSPKFAGMLDAMWDTGNPQAAFEAFASSILSKSPSAPVDATDVQGNRNRMMIAMIKSNLTDSEGLITAAEATAAAEAYVLRGDNSLLNALEKKLREAGMDRVNDEGVAEAEDTSAKSTAETKSLAKKIIANASSKTPVKITKKVDGGNAPATAAVEGVGQSTTKTIVSEPTTSTAESILSANMASEEVVQNGQEEGAQGGLQIAQAEGEVDSSAADLAARLESSNEKQKSPALQFLDDLISELESAITEMESEENETKKELLQIKVSELQENIATLARNLNIPLPETNSVRPADAPPIAETPGEEATSEHLQAPLEEQVDNLSEEDQAVVVAETGETSYNQAAKQTLIDAVKDYIINGIAYGSAKFQKIVKRLATSVSAAFMMVAGVHDLNAIQSNPDKSGAKQVEIIKNTVSASSPEEVLRAVIEQGRNENQGRPFIVVDKPTATAKFFDKNGSLEFETPVLLGQSTVDVTSDSIMSKGVDELTDNEKITPAGKFDATQNSKNKYGEGSLRYGPPDWMLALHATATDPDIAWQKRHTLYAKDPSQRRVSWGCINWPTGTFDKHIRGKYDGGSSIYITPDNMNNAGAVGLATSYTESRAKRVGDTIGEPVQMNMRPGQGFNNRGIQLENEFATGVRMLATQLGADPKKITGFESAMWAILEHGGRLPKSGEIFNIKLRKVMAMAGGKPTISMSAIRHATEVYDGWAKEIQASPVRVFGPDGRPYVVPGIEGGEGRAWPSIGGRHGEAAAGQGKTVADILGKSPNEVARALRTIEGSSGYYNGVKGIATDQRFIKRSPIYNTFIDRGTRNQDGTVSVSCNGKRFAGQTPVIEIDPEKNTIDYTLKGTDRSGSGDLSMRLEVKYHPDLGPVLEIGHVLAGDYEGKGIVTEIVSSATFMAKQLYPGIRFVTGDVIGIRKPFQSPSQGFNNDPIVSWRLGFPSTMMFAYALDDGANGGARVTWDAITDINDILSRNRMKLDRTFVNKATSPAFKDINQEYAKAFGKIKNEDIPYSWADVIDSMAVFDNAPDSPNLNIGGMSDGAVLGNIRPGGILDAAVEAKRVAKQVGHISRERRALGYAQYQASRADRDKVGLRFDEHVTDLRPEASRDLFNRSADTLERVFASSFVQAIKDAGFGMYLRVRGLQEAEKDKTIHELLPMREDIVAEMRHDTPATRAMASIANEGTNARDAKGNIIGKVFTEAEFAQRMVARGISDPERIKRSYEFYSKKWLPFWSGTVKKMHMDAVESEHLESLRKIDEAIRTAKTLERKKRFQDIRQKMLDTHNQFLDIFKNQAYVPLERKGQMRVQIVKLDANGNKPAVVTARNSWVAYVPADKNAAEDALNGLIARDPTLLSLWTQHHAGGKPLLSIESNSRPEEDSSALEMSFAKLHRLATMAAMDDAEIDKLEATLSAINNIASMRVHTMRRRGYRGASDNPLEIFDLFVPGLANTVAKAKYSFEQEEAYKNLDRTNVKLMTYIDSIDKELDATAGRVDDIINGIKQLNFIWSIGFRPIMFVQQAVQRLTHTMPQLVADFGGRAKKYFNISGGLADAVGVASYSIANKIRTRSLTINDINEAFTPELMERFYTDKQKAADVADEVRKLVWEEYERGLFLDNPVSELTEGTIGGSTSWHSNLSQMAGFMMSISETANRLHALTLGYLAASDYGIPSHYGNRYEERVKLLNKRQNIPVTDHQMAKEFAHDFVLRTQLPTGSRLYRSAIERGKFALIGRPAMQFKPYMINTMAIFRAQAESIYAEQRRQGKTKKQALIAANRGIALHGLTTLIAGGARGVPLAFAMFGIASFIGRMITGDDKYDAYEELLAWLSDQLGMTTAKALTDGVSNLAGVDFGPMFRQDIMPMIREDASTLEYFAAMAGGPTASRIVEYDRFNASRKRGDTMLESLMAIAPIGLRRPIRGATEVATGVRNVSGIPIEVNKAQGVAEAFGVTTTQKSLDQLVVAHDAKMTTQRREIIKLVASGIANAILNDREPSMDRYDAMIESFNNKVSENKFVANQDSLFIDDITESVERELGRKLGATERAMILRGKMEELR